MRTAQVAYLKLVLKVHLIEQKPPIVFYTRLTWGSLIQEKLSSTS